MRGQFSATLRRVSSGQIEECGSWIAEQKTVTRSKIRIPHPDCFIGEKLFHFCFKCDTLRAVAERCASRLRKSSDLEPKHLSVLSPLNETATWFMRSER